MLAGNRFQNYFETPKKINVVVSQLSCKFRRIRTYLEFTVFPYFLETIVDQ